MIDQSNVNERGASMALAPVSCEGRIHMSSHD